MNRNLGKTATIFMILALAALAVGLRASIDRVADAGPTTAPISPITYELVERQNPPLHLHFVTVNLRDPRVRLRVCPGGLDPDGPGPWQTTIKPVSKISEENNLAAAVNGNFFGCKDAHTFAGRKIPYFTGNWARVTDWAMTDGRLWGHTDSGGHSLLVTRDGHVSIEFFPTNKPLPKDAWQVASGSELIVKDGKTCGTALDLAPRTVVGLNRDASKLVMLVVDGRKSDYSVGMTSIEAGKEMIARGCTVALNLDGGGSSTMVVRDPVTGTLRVVNRPSDGHDLPISMSIERPVACALGVELVERK